MQIGVLLAATAILLLQTQKRVWRVFLNTLLCAQSHAGRKLAQSVVEGTQAQTVRMPGHCCCAGSVLFHCCCVAHVPAPCKVRPAADAKHQCVVRHDVYVCLRS